MRSPELRDEVRARRKQAKRLTRTMKRLHEPGQANKSVYVKTLDENDELKKEVLALKLENQDLKSLNAGQNYTTPGQDGSTTQHEHLSRLYQAAGSILETNMGCNFLPELANAIVKGNLETRPGENTIQAAIYRDQMINMNKHATCLHRWGDDVKRYTMMQKFQNSGKGGLDLRRYSHEGRWNELLPSDTTLNNGMLHLLVPS